jgi:hypothetical protein
MSRSRILCAAVNKLSVPSIVTGSGDITSDTVRDASSRLEAGRRVLLVRPLLLARLVRLVRRAVVARRVVDFVVRFAPVDRDLPVFRAAARERPRVVFAGMPTTSFDGQLRTGYPGLASAKRCR